MGGQAFCGQALIGRNVYTETMGPTQIFELGGFMIPAVTM
jgi:hypothetical protein